MISRAILGHTAAGAALELDVDRLIGSHMGIVANSGAGKSGLIRKLLEATHGRVQHIVLDAEDEFYTLRERFEYVIAGGEGGDAPATIANAETLAIGALTHGFSLIAQLNDLGFDGAPAFIGRFLTALVNAPRDLWHPVLVIVDEAQRFVPRQGDTGATAGIKDLISRGRKRGFTAILAGTKFTEIDPSVRGSVNNWLLGRVGQAVDRNTMGNQLGFTPAEARDKLRSIEPRHFWAAGPALSPEPVLFRVDDVATTPVHAGQAKVPTPPPPEALRKILQGLAPPAEPDQESGGGAGAAEADATLRKRVDELGARNWELIGENDQLRADLAKAEALLERRTRMLTAIGAVLVSDVELGRQADLHSSNANLHENAGSAEEVVPSPPPDPRSGVGEARAVPERSSSASPEPGPPAGDRPHLPPRRQRILDAITWANVFLKRPSVPRPIVAFVADTTPKSSTFEKDLGAMRSDALILYPADGEVALAEAGRGLAQPLDAPATREALWDAIVAKLPPRRVRILGELWHGSSPVSRGILAGLCDTTERSSTFEKDLGAMRTLGLIDYPEKGKVQLAPLYREGADA